MTAASRAIAREATTGEGEETELDTTSWTRGAARHEARDHEHTQRHRTMTAASRTIPHEATSREGAHMDLGATSWTCGAARREERDHKHTQRQKA